MDSNRIEGSWAELKGKAKQQWGNLTDNEHPGEVRKRESSKALASPKTDLFFK